MEYAKEQIEALKGYCSKVRALAEGNDTYLHLEKLRLPEGCEPRECDALLRPFPGADGYPSQLYFSVQVSSSYTRNWNVSNVRICEKNWFAFSWRVTPSSPTLGQILVGHLTGFTKEK
ncbi:MAG: hypothetical protein LAP86_15680 [Acidobacteriia bacterium]|nr:hypothetical protein [Terriglobia bacterium]